jgi:hypoxanthine phosphoribosyltransferase
MPMQHDRPIELDIDRVLLTREQIADRVRELADQIARAYRSNPEGLVLVAILSGAVIFLADLIRHLPMKMRIGLITLSSYPGATVVSRGPRILQNLNLNVAGRHVLVLDDILDTGQTLRMVLAQLAEEEPASLRTCVLLRKPAKAPQDLPADFVGFDIEDVFVVGYGLDYNDHYRNYPHIGVLRSELYAIPEKETDHHANR